eukprot:TRINITY_DN42493_c1_g1_i3.p1 TRINITY_DN42493_c1_g1~~TRINITY_DN42493_c1_g1_i3.p1  ORF type:complete len:240 (-),score=59.08 TRINITY_DN42493_c1_g1_i3:304-1023(-)
MTMLQRAAFGLGLLWRHDFAFAEEGTATTAALVKVLLAASNDPGEDAAWLPGVQEKAAQCLEEAASWHSFQVNMTEISGFLKDPPGDPILALRATLQRVCFALSSVQSAAAACLSGTLAAAGKGGASLHDLRDGVVHLCSFVKEGNINDGHCPFTGKSQTTVGGTDVRKELRKLRDASWGDRDGVEKAARTLRKFLKKVRRADGKPAPGATPVNWEMRSAMFDGDRVEAAILGGARTEL